MSVSDARKVDFVWKKIKGRIFTDNIPYDSGKEFYEEFPGVLVNPHSSEIWISEIPIPAPGLSTSVVEFYDNYELTEDLSVANHRSWFVCSTVGDPTTKISGWVPPRFHQSYTVRIYDNNGIEITTTHDATWFFDYENGVLVFENDPTSYGLSLPIHITGYKYIGETLQATALHVGLNTYEVTSPFQTNEIIDITTGSGNLSGTSDILRTDNITLGLSEADFLSNNDIQILLNGVKVEKLRDLTYIDDTHFSFSIPLDIGDIFEIQRL